MDTERTPETALDRHVLATALWLACALVVAVLLDVGFRNAELWAVAAGFATVLAAFAGHVVVNAVYRTGFSPRELALGLVAYAAGLIAFVFAVLLVPGFAERFFAVSSLGFLALAIAVLFYMVTRHGLRSVFEAFDVIRDFRPGARPGDAQ